MKTTMAFALAAAAASSAIVLASCVTTKATVKTRGDGLDAQTLPAAIRPDYELFAQRCSKCHSLSRALDNGHIEDRFWEVYVDRMRHQPGSAIAPEDVPSILRFLHYYSTEVVVSDPKESK